MILAIECVVFCIIFTLMIMPAQYKNPIVMIMSYPPNVIKRVEQLPQYEGCIKEREKKHISLKIFGVFFFAVILAIVAYFSGCREFGDTFFHVFMLFFVVNLYDMLVLDWGVFCHSKKLRIPGTEDMDKDYKDYLFHAKGAMKGTLIGIVIAILSAAMVFVVGGSNESAYQVTEVENVSISISDVSSTGATVIIKDTNETPYLYGEWFAVEKEKAGKWYEVKTIIDNYGFNDLGYLPNNDGEVIFTIDWEWLYGELPAGNYRLLKWVNSKYISVEFSVVKVESLR